MRRKMYILVAGLAILSVGCPVRSIFPFLTQKDHVFDPALLGKWLLVGSKPQDTVSVSGSMNGYDINYPVLREDSKILYHRYIGLLGHLGRHTYLDTYQQISINHETQDHMIPSHQLHRVWLHGDTLELTSLDNDWLTRMVDSAGIRIGHVSRDRELILTASTKELQAFVLRYTETPGAFAKSAIYVRMK